LILKNETGEIRMLPITEEDIRYVRNRLKFTWLINCEICCGVGYLSEEPILSLIGLCAVNDFAKAILAQGSLKYLKNRITDTTLKWLDRLLGQFIFYL
jgi:hypothetical protein